MLFLNVVVAVLVIVIIMIVKFILLNAPLEFRYHFLEFVYF